MKRKCCLLLSSKVSRRYMLLLLCLCSHHRSARVRHTPVRSGSVQPDPYLPVRANPDVPDDVIRSRKPDNSHRLAQALVLPEDECLSLSRAVRSALPLNAGSVDVEPNLRPGEQRSAPHIIQVRGVARVIRTDAVKPGLRVRCERVRRCSTAAVIREERAGTTTATSSDDRT